MRDHYYQLFDLEKNFGEKRFCDGKSAEKPHEQLAKALGIRVRRSQAKEKIYPDEKPTGPFGYSLGIELTPEEELINDCCVLNWDEKYKNGGNEQADIKFFFL